MKCVTLCGLLLCLIPAAVFAQETRPADQSELIRTLIARIDALEKRLQQVEGGQKGEAAAAAPARPEAPAARAEAPQPAEHHGPTLSAEPPPSYPWLKIGGFSDFNFSASDAPGSKSGFTEGQFVLHFSSALSSRVSVFGETSFAARADAGTGSPAAAGFNVEVERGIIRFDQSDYFKVSFGRYHTPINWWNATYHHGQWLQTSIDRPEMTRFGGQFIPVHFVGALIEGAVPAGGANIGYNLGVGNGRSSVISRAGDAGDVNNNRAWLINVFVRPDVAPALQIGGSTYRDKISVPGAREYREWITAAHLIWQKETPEVIAEFANVNHQEIGGSASFNSRAFYAQAGYRLHWFDNLFKPYYRFERITVQRADPIFRLLPDLNGSVVGVRYDLSPFAALKGEYRRQRRSGQPDVNAGFMQISFTF